MSQLIMDLIVLALLLLCALVGWKKGFFRSLVNTIGSIFLYMIAYFGSKLTAPLLYQKYIGPYFLERIERYITNVGEGVRIESTVINAMNRIPKFCRELLLHDTTTEDFIKTISDQANHNVEHVAKLLVDEYIPTVIIPLLQGILFLLMLMLLFFLLRGIILLLGNHAAKKSLLGRVDSMLGAVCGIGFGIILLFVIAFVVQLVVGFTSNSLSFCNTDIIEQSILFRWIYQIVDSGMIVTAG